MTTIHPQLQADCVLLGRFKLCHLLLMKDAHYPWCVLVPDRDNISEIYQLEGVDQQQLLQESSLLGQVLMQTFSGDKLNIAALGNVVPQLHVHHVVRYVDDSAWPAPVWGKVAVKPYSDAALDEVVGQVCLALKGQLEA